MTAQDTNRSVLSTAVASEILLSRTIDLLEVETDIEMFGLDTDRYTCFGFNASAYQIWKQIEQPKTLAAVCDALVAKFDVALGQCEREVRTIVAELCAEGLCAVSIK